MSIIDGVCVRFADKVLRLHVHHKETGMYCREYLTEEPRFGSKEANNVLDVYMTSEDAVREWKQVLAKEHGAKAKEDVNRLPAYYFEICALQRKIAEVLLPYGILMVQGCCAAVDQEGYLFLGSSEARETAQGRLWCQAFGNRANLLRDGRLFLRRTENGDIYVYGTPWSKQKRGKNDSVKLAAFCRISEHAADFVTDYPKMRRKDLLYQKMIPPQKRELFKSLEYNLEQVFRRVPVFTIKWEEDMSVSIRIQKEIKRRLGQ